jgi:hypothetical protein
LACTTVRYFASKEIFAHTSVIYRHQVFGELLDQYPQYSSRVKGWRQSSFHYQAAANFNNIRKKGFSNTKKEFSANPAVVALVENTQLTPYRPARVIYKFQRFVGKAVVRAVLMQLGKDVSTILSNYYYIRQSAPCPKNFNLFFFYFRKRKLRKI